ncbi:hypothetical protein [Kribbella antiqua]|nr:hypothetical protein [Kribbella antiqua]
MSNAGTPERFPAQERNHEKCIRDEPPPPAAALDSTGPLPATAYRS